MGDRTQTWLILGALETRRAAVIMQREHGKQHTLARQSQLNSDALIGQAM